MIPIPEPILTADAVAEVRNLCATSQGVPLTDEQMELVSVACWRTAEAMRRRWRHLRDAAGMVVTSLEETPDNDPA